MDTGIPSEPWWGPHCVLIHLGPCSSPDPDWVPIVYSVTGPLPGQSVLSSRTVGTTSSLKGKVGLVVTVVGPPISFLSPIPTLLTTLGIPVEDGSSQGCIWGREDLRVESLLIRNRPGRLETIFGGRSFHPSSSRWRGREKELSHQSRLECGSLQVLLRPFLTYKRPRRESSSSRLGRGRCVRVCAT